MIPKANRFLEDIIYALKREFGFKATLYLDTFTLDIDTGVKVRSTEIKEIKRAIILPSDWKRKFSYDLSFIAANKNFTYGGFYDVNTRIFIIDVRDIPNYVITLDHKLVVSSSKYNLVSVNLLEQDKIWVLTGVALRNEPPNQVINISVAETISISEDTSVSTE